MVTDSYSANAASAAPCIQRFERELGDAWRSVRGDIFERGEVQPATELCGEVAEFMGMLGDED